MPRQSWQMSSVSAESPLPFSSGDEVEGRQRFASRSRQTAQTESWRVGEGCDIAFVDSGRDFA